MDTGAFASVEPSEVRKSLRVSIRTDVFPRIQIRLFAFSQFRGTVLLYPPASPPLNSRLDTSLVLSSISTRNPSTRTHALPRLSSFPHPRKRVGRKEKKTTVFVYTVGWEAFDNLLSIGNPASVEFVRPDRISRVSRLLLFSKVEGGREEGRGGKGKGRNRMRMDGGHGWLCGDLSIFSLIRLPPFPPSVYKRSMFPSSPIPRLRTQLLLLPPSTSTSHSPNHARRSSRYWRRHRC